MIETLLTTICLYAPYAHWMIFVLLLLAGLNLPISEDLLLLTGGFLAGNSTLDSPYFLFGWIYVGCLVSAWESYWIGRSLGPKLYQFKWFNYILNPLKVDKLNSYYEKFGIWTFIVGRFIPGGVRNALFMTSGLGKMPFLTFIARDGFACLLSTSVLFLIGYFFGEHYHQVIKIVQSYHLLILSLLIPIIFFFIYRFVRYKKSTI